MRRFVTIAVTGWLLLICAAPAVAQSAPPRPFDPVAQTAVDELASAGIDNGITGITVGISDPSLGYLVKSYGTADISGSALTPRMHYRIASVTKTFTALAVLRLAQQGKLSLDDRISSYIQDIPKACQIRIRDLLAMRGGVYDFTADHKFDVQYSRDPELHGWRPADVLSIIRKHWSKAKAPDRRTVYSNSEYILLGYVIRKASGQSAHRYITSTIHRLGLANTTFATRNRLPAPFVHGYLGRGSSVHKPSSTDVTVSNPWVPWTAGAIVSTVPSMLKYARQLGTGAGLSRRYWKQRRSWGPLTQTGVKLQYGLGLTQLGNWIGHDGSIFGFSDMVFYLPAKKVSVVVMANAGDGENVPAQAVWGQIVNRLYPGTLTQWG